MKGYLWPDWRVAVLAGLAIALTPAPAGAAGGTLVLPGAGGAAHLNGSAARAAARPPAVLRTPGYRGTRNVPAAKPQTPPPPVVIGTGAHPSVVVDGAGTAHVVWNETVNGGGPDITHYCRLPRGATACDNPDGTPFPIPYQYANDLAGPKIFQIGDQLVMLTRRYPSSPMVTQPDGVKRDRTTFAWTSNDGGQSWTGPGIVGTLPPYSAALVGGSDPRIVVASSGYTPGAAIQVLDSAGFTPVETILGDPQALQLYEGQVAADGDGVVVAFSGAIGPVTLWHVGSVGAASAAGAWNPSAPIDAQYPRLAGGPAGPFMLATPNTGNVPRLWSVAGGTGTDLGPVTDQEGRSAALAETASGNLQASWTSGAPVTLTTGAFAADGHPLTPAFPVATAVNLDDVTSSAAGDGGGVVVFRQDQTQIAVGAFGTLAPTGQPGAGSRAGSGIPGGYAGCTAAGFGGVKLSPKAGCLLQSTDPRYAGAFVSRSTVDLNGLTLIPDANVSIVFDPAKRTLDTSGKVTVALTGPAIGTIPLAHLELHVKLGAAVGTPLFQGVDFPSGPKIKGFPIDASFKPVIDGSGVRLPISLRLPDALGGLSGSATLRAQIGTGAQLDSFVLSASNIPLGPIAIKGLSVGYTAAGEVWNGSAKVQFPAGALGLQIGFAGGRFSSARFDLGFPRPGVPVFAQAYLTEVHGALSLDPRFKALVGATLGLIYAPAAQTYAALVNGDLSVEVTASGSLLFKVEGSASTVGLKLGDAEAELDTRGYAAMRAKAQIDLTIARIDGDANGFFDGRSGKWGLSADDRLSALGITVARAAFGASAAGIGVCATASPPLPPLVSLDDGVQPAHIQLTYRWGDKLPDIAVGTSCSIDRYVVAPPAAASAALGRAAQAQPGDRRIAISGRRPVNVVLGAAAGTGVPDVEVLDPAGAAPDPKTVRMFPIAGADRLLVVLTAPKQGVWTLRPKPGSAAIDTLTTARQLAPVKVRGTLSGGRRGRVLRYTVSAPAGTKIEFRERAAAASRILGAARGRRGRLRITDDGRGGRRQIVALALRSGIPVETIAIARYTAPKPKRLTAPRRLRIAGAGARWAAVTGARSYLVTADLSDGRRLATTVRAARIARLPGAARSAKVRRLRVAAIDARGRLGRPATARR